MSGRAGMRGIDVAGAGEGRSLDAPIRGMAKRVGLDSLCQ